MVAAHPSQSRFTIEAPPEVGPAASDPSVAPPLPHVLLTTAPAPRWRPFQRRVRRALRSDEYDVVALSGPRGIGKTTLVAYEAIDAMEANPGKEIIIISGSLEQGRQPFRILRDVLEPRGGFRFRDSTTSVSVLHISSGTRITVRACNSRTSLGLIHVPLAICDEPGAWTAGDGAALWDSLKTAIGKVGSPLKVLIVGTLAPATGGWWPDLVNDGTQGRTYVEFLQGDRKRWDDWHNIRKVNPLMAADPHGRRVLLAERDEARKSTAKRAAFESFRLNIPSRDETTVLLTVEDFDLMESRALPDPLGRPVVGLDMGMGRSWSAAVAIWPGGRIEALAVAPGVPSLRDQEVRDRVDRGLYRALHDRGQLEVADGKRVPPASLLWETIRARWGRPARIICDRFRLSDLQDAVQGAVPVEPRVTRWSEAAADIQALRTGAKDGPFAIAPDSRFLVGVHVAAAMVKSDDMGNTRLQKKTGRTQARDDVAAALTLAAGAFARAARARARARPRRLVAVAS